MNDTFETTHEAALYFVGLQRWEMQRTLQDRVHKGAQFLDVEYGTLWPWRVNLANLNFSIPSRGVLAHLYGGNLLDAIDDFSFTIADLYAYGFCVPEDEGYDKPPERWQTACQELRMAWLREIRIRKAARKGKRRAKDHTGNGQARV
jgi:hypothetical protein